MNLLVIILFYFIYYTLLIRVLLSWFPLQRSNEFSKFIFIITEPILAPIRNLIPKNETGIDFSPLIVFILLSLIRSQLFRLG